VVIPLGGRLPGRSSGLPGGFGRATLKRPPMRPFSGRGLPCFPPLREETVGSYPTFSPLPQGQSPEAVCFLWHFPGVTPSGCYPAPCPAEPGLSSEDPQGLRRPPTDPLLTNNFKTVIFGHKRTNLIKTKSPQNCSPTHAGNKNIRFFSIKANCFWASSPITVREFLFRKGF